MNKFLHGLCLFLALFILKGIAPPLAIAQDAAANHHIRLKTGAIIPAANAGRWLDSMAQFPAPKEPVQVLVHFKTLPTEQQKKALKQNGISLLEYLPENTYTAIVTLPLHKEALAAMPIHSFINMRPEMKADDYLWQKINSKKGSIEILVSFYGEVDAAAIHQFIASAGGRLEKSKYERFGAYKVIIAANRVSALSQWYGVRYLSPVVDKMVALDNQSMPPMKSNIAAGPLYNGGYGLTGDSVTVGVGDDAAGVYHVDLEGRITNFNPSSASLHGELVNGIVGSAAIMDPFAATMTPHVALVDHYFDNLLDETGAMYNDYNMTVGNNSYEIIAGDCSYAGTYDVYSNFLDTLSIEYPNVQQVFASGNDGYITCSPFVPGFGTVGGGYQPAKNNIVVGSMTDFLIEADDESRGPVKDGRLKPDMISIGLGTYSCALNNQYNWNAGTSMASPQVAGGVAALTQRYKQLNGGAQPRADLLKALMLDGAMDIGNPGPDYSYGFGGMDMYHSLQILDRHQYVVSSMSTGDSQSFTITIPANTGQIKVMLYWNDMPGHPAASVALVNDLDLTVTTPSSQVHRPLILDPTPANVNNNATEGVDHINNVEQVVINNPAAGVYTITTKGYAIPSGPQPYVVAYDILPDTMRLTSPAQGQQFPNMTGDSIRIFWDQPRDGNTFTGQFSSDNGATWATIPDSVPADARHCDYLPFGLNSGNCLMRITNNGTMQTATSGRFVVNTAPVITLDTDQCPTYINIHWSPVPNATAYYLVARTGLYMQVVDSVSGGNDTTYSFKNMPFNALSYIAVQPVLAGLPGYRGLSVIAQANTGNCTNPISNGDLLLQNVVSPTNGRMYTSTQLNAGTPVQVTIRDLYQAACTRFTLSYKVNGGAWQQLVNPDTIPANNTAVISIPGISFSDTGAYNIVVAVTNTGLPDPQPGNDTLAFTILNIPNDTINLATPFFDGFETMPKISVTTDSIGVSPNGHWDFFNINDSGHMRSFVDDHITITGTRSISLDEAYCTTNGSKNTFVGTFNLTRYDTATTEIRMDFDYVLHGTPKTDSGNIVSAHGDDTSAWIPIFAYDFAAYAGYVTPVNSLSLTDALRKGGRNFSASTQVSFGQNDTSLIALSDYGNGLTIDNFRLYTVSNDAQMVSIISPLPTNCGLPVADSLKVQVRNGVQQTLHNIQLFYSLDGGPTFTGTIDSLAAKATAIFTFSQPLSLPPGTTHTLNVWLAETGDSYNANDSILNYSIRNSMVYTSFPYLENFEAGDGGYFSGGYLDSWQYGTPAAPIIHNAASGTKAWKTNLTGNYNDLEKSYLYSPCFDISQLAHPMLSFSNALALENCGSTLCDAAYMEYSFDGITWTKLGAAGQGTNWYDSTFNLWNAEGFTRWHVASIPLPISDSATSFRFRFDMAADPAVNFEGIAVDDIHIFDLNYPILPAAGVTSVSASVDGNIWTDYTWDNLVLASLNANSQSIANVDVTLYGHDTLNNPGATQYTFPRSYTVAAAETPADSMVVRLYLTDSEFVNVLSDTGCPSCTPITDAYRLGITQYSNAFNANLQNGTLADDTGGTFSYHPWQSVTWVPYDQGYYAQFNAMPLSEYWFNNGGPTVNFPAGVDYLNFTAYRTGTNATVAWYSLIDTAVGTYMLQRSTDSINFSDVLDTNATHSNPGVYSYTDPVNITSSTTLYYRLRWMMSGQSTMYYSPIRPVNYGDTANGQIAFSAQMINNTDVAINWSSAIDGLINHYILERAIANSPYKTIANITAAHISGYPYYFQDQPGPLGTGTRIHYRLTAIMEDSAKLQPPVQTVDWVNANSIVNLFPNPTYDGVFTIVWNATPGTLMNVNIVNELGQSMYRTNVVSTQWTNTTTLPTFHRPQGVYTAIIDIAGAKTKVKIVYQ